MIEVRGNLWTYPADVRIITTNGFVKKNGECVMGRGCAREAALRFPKLPRELGEWLTVHGNRAVRFPEYGLMTFPVKHNWYEKADLDLIKKSASLLYVEAIAHPVEYLLPRPGCGNGQLSWSQVGPLLMDLPDNVKVIDFG